MRSSTATRLTRRAQPKAGAARGSTAPNALEKMYRPAVWKRRDRRNPTKAWSRRNRRFDNRDRNGDGGSVGPLNAFHRQSCVTLAATLQPRTSRHPGGIRSLHRLATLAAAALATCRFGRTRLARDFRNAPVPKIDAAPTRRQNHANAGAKHDEFEEVKLHRRNRNETGLLKHTREGPNGKP
jgi:hypothetical protein